MEKADNTLTELRQLAEAALSLDPDFGGRNEMEATEEDVNGAHIWGDDGDELATVHGNMVLGIDATALARWWAAMTPARGLKLLSELEALRRK